MSEKLEDLVQIVSDERGRPCHAVESDMPDTEEGTVYGIYAAIGPQSTLGAHVRVRPDGELEWALWNLAKRRYTRGETIDLTEFRASGAAHIDVLPPKCWLPALEDFRRAFSGLPDNEESYGIIVEAACRTGARANWCPGILRRLRPELTREQAHHNAGVLRIQRSLSEANRLWSVSEQLLRDAGVNIGSVSWNPRES